MEVQKPEHPVETIRHLADREHDYVYSRSSYFILSETVLLTVFVLAVDLKLRLACLAYVPLALAGLVLSVLWVVMGSQSQRALQIVRLMVAKRKKHDPDGYEDCILAHMQVYKDFYNRRRQSRPRLSKPPLDEILLRWIPLTFLVLWGFMLILALTNIVPFPCYFSFR